jgi:hypothetical protein
MTKSYYLKVELKELTGEEKIELPEDGKGFLRVRSSVDGLKLFDLFVMLHIIEPGLRESIPEYIKWMQKIRHFIENP